MLSLTPGREILVLLSLAVCCCLAYSELFDTICGYSVLVNTFASMFNRNLFPSVTQSTNQPILL